MTGEKKRVVILGCGFGGLEVARQLKNYCGKQLQITVVDKHDFFTFIPAIYRVAAATEDEKRIVFPLPDFFRKKGMTFLKDTVKAIDCTKKTVELAAAPPLSYDFLIIALGSSTNYFGIPGAKEYSLELKSLEDAITIRDAINKAILRLTEPQESPQPVHIVVMGGGLSGIETVCELEAYARRLCREYGIDARFVTLTVVERTPHVLYTFGERVYLPVEKRLQRFGIELRTGITVTRVEKDRIIAGADAIPFDVLVWTGGIQPHEIMETVEGLSKGLLGITVNTQLQFAQDPVVFGAGDNIVYNGVVRTAQNAIREGDHVAKNICRILRNQPLLEYKKGFLMPLLIDLGRGYGLFAYKNIVLKGRLVYLLKRLVQWHYIWSRKH